MDAHGRIALVSAVVTLASLAIGILIIFLTGWSLPAAAALVAGPITFGIGGSVLFYGFRFLEIGFFEYLSTVMRDGLVLLIVVGMALLLLRLFSGLPSIGLVAVGVTIACVIPVVIHRKEVASLYRSIRA